MYLRVMYVYTRTLFSTCGTCTCSLYLAWKYILYMYILYRYTHCCKNKINFETSVKVKDVTRYLLVLLPLRKFTFYPPYHLLASFYPSSWYPRKLALTRASS